VRIIWHDDALDDLDGIRAYIAQDNPPAARRVTSRIRTGVELLLMHPMLGRAGRVAETREFVFSDIPYIAIHRIDGQRAAVEILRIIHTAQQYPRRT